MIQEEYKIEKKTKKGLIILSLLFLILYYNSSYNIQTISGTMSLWVSGCAAVVFMILGKEIRFRSGTFLIIGILCVNVITTSLFTGDSLKDLSIILLVIIISYLITISMNFLSFIKYYNKVLFFLSVYSLLTYIVAIILPQMIRLFPAAYFRPNQEVYNLVFSFVNLRPSLIRNMSIFWEPGAFQTYLVIAILGEMFICGNRKRILIVYFLALITTWSTIGLINAFLLLIIYIAYKNKKKQLKYFKLIITIIVLMLAFLLVYSISPYEIQYALFGKISVFLNSDQSAVTSAYVRLTSTTYPLKAFLNSPIIGVGYNGLRDSILPAGHTMVTNTPVNWFAAYGIFFGIICSLGIWGLAGSLVKKDIIVKLLVFVVLLLAIISEQYLRNISFFVFIIYGIGNFYTSRKKTDIRLK